MELCWKRRGIVSRRGMVNIFLFEKKTCGIVLNALESVDRGFIYTKEKGIAVVDVRHDETENAFGICFSR